MTTPEAQNSGERLGVPNLEESFTYIRDGEETTVKMTFGLLNVLLQSVGNLQNVSLVGVDPTINDIVLRKFLTKRDHKGKPAEASGKDLEAIWDIDISVLDTERALYFCQSHMVDFSLRAINRAAKLKQDTQAAQTQISDLARGLIGGLASASSNAAASFSEKPPAN